MGRMAGKTNKFLLIQVFVRLCFYNILFVVTVKAKGISNLSNECFYLAFVDIMTSDAIHSSRPMNESKVLYDRRMTFQTDILGRDHHSACTPVAGGTVIFTSYRWMAVSSGLCRQILFWLTGLGGLGRIRLFFLLGSIGVGNPVEEHTKNLIPGIFITPCQNPEESE